MKEKEAFCRLFKRRQSLFGNSPRPSHAYIFKILFNVIDRRQVGGPFQMIRLVGQKSGVIDAMLRCALRVLVHVCSQFLVSKLAQEFV